MNLLRVFSIAALLCTSVTMCRAQNPTQTPSPDRETDPDVLKHLEWFQDQKFGLLMHWGPYSQWGVVESWSICSEDEPWCRRNMDDYVEYCRAYEKLKETFKPVKFDPDAWASAAAEAGMKYVVFTTKHHDGFCMFDTKQTDYKITDPGCPFSASPRANVTKEILDAFRRRGFGAGVYFSKPDWHSRWYWNPYWAHADRNVNYSIAKHPDLWEKFRSYTFNQIEELMTQYGKIDILWLDGGWVNPSNRGQDIDMPGIAQMARGHQKGLIIVDRAVGGRYENYRTPEQEVPEKPLGYLWETCMTMGRSWSYVPSDVYKPTRTLIQLLVDIVAKGGNFLLNIGPSPQGEFPNTARERLHEIGAWMKVNGGALYGTRPVAPYAEGELRFTRDTSGAVNVIYLAGEKEQAPPANVIVSSFRPKAGSRITLLGATSPLAWHLEGERTAIEIPAGVREHPPCEHAWTVRIEETLR